MIITENDPKAGLKGGPSRSLEPGTSGPSTSAVPPPPAYEPPPVTAQSNPLMPPEAPKAYPRRNPALWRFLKAFIVASLVWLLATVLIRSIVDVAHGRGGPPRGGRQDWGHPVNPGRDDGDISDSRDCEPDSADMEFPLNYFRRPRQFPQMPHEQHGPPPPHHDDGPHFEDAAEHGPFIYKASYTLSASAELLYFISRGSHSTGSITYEPVKDAEKVTVEVDMKFWDSNARQKVRMCKLHRGDKAIGFGIFTPTEHWDWLPEFRRQIQFTVRVRVPIGDHSSFTSLHSSLPNFSQHLGSFAEYQYFNTIHLQSTNGALTAESFAAHNVSLHTTNAKITGHYITDDTLALVTANGHIEAQVDALNEHSHKAATQVSLITTNAHIKSSVSLSTVAAGDRSFPGTNGQFTVYAATTNGAFNLDVPTAPLSPHLDLEGTTTNSHASVYLHRAVEASFTLTSTNAGSPRAVSHLTSSDDPTGNGRTPNLVTSKMEPNLLQGTWWWGHSKPSQYGTISVKTTNGKSLLTIV